MFWILGIMSDLKKTKTKKPCRLNCRRVQSWCIHTWLNASCCWNKNNAPPVGNEYIYSKIPHIMLLLLLLTIDTFQVKLSIIPPTGQIPHFSSFLWMLVYTFFCCWSCVLKNKPKDKDNLGKPLRLHLFFQWLCRRRECYACAPLCCLTGLVGLSPR